ncbi:MAG: EscU/YscU/HrcU family type III secretion system export apparatus switch protein [Bacillota bacterium]|nr:EscU/YscU/HrcU family type III secretion system export apparatus switch protein [Bacillota bacterium]
MKKKAVALVYDHKENSAPEILAKGNNQIADKIIALAKEHNIPICSNPLLVEQLAELDIGQVIPEELYQVVAEILIFIDRLFNPCNHTIF